MKKTKFFTAPLTILAILASNFAFLPLIQRASAAVSQVGPVVPVVDVTGTGFPAWYKDGNGLALDLMEAADTFGISAPVEAGNAFSEQIGFGAEGFWWSAGSTMDTPGGKAKLVLALEAAFAGESAVDGQQSSFGRVRFQIDGLTPGATYTIRHPYGNATEVADEFGSIFATSDIGCFAVAGASSCDPNSPLGSPLPQFNFAAALSSQVQPFLTWNTFDPVNVTDPDLINPANPTRKYVGNPGIDHAVTGSPIGQNKFRIEGTDIGGVGTNFIETNLFSVTGRLAEAVAPVIAPVANQTVQVGNPISFTASATDINLDPITFSVTPVSALGNEAAATIDPATGVFSWTPTTTGIATFTIGASDGTLSSVATVTIEVAAAAPTLASIVVTPATASVVEGATRQLAASTLDAGGGQIIPAPALTWTSDNEAVATVSASGLVTAVAAGTATITAANGLINDTALITVTPVVLVGGGLTASIPVEPTTGFPKWYKDRNGLALDLMEAADAFGISAPVDGVGTFSEQIGFGAEGFWATADATMGTTGAKPAVLVQAVEAAFSGGEVAVDGQQSAFGRVRIRIDINEPGTYTVTYPYGQKSYTVTAGEIGSGYEINDTNDIGCFAIEGVSSCDPNSPLGSPQAAFNFNGVKFSEIGPFLSWSTFNPLNNDPALSNPANPTRKYLGNAAVAHAIKGSPTGNNFFRIEGPAGVDLDPAAGVQNSIQTNLFNVSGRLADVTAPVITVLPPTPDTVLQNAVYVDPGATAVDDFDGDVTANIQATTLNTAILGPQNITYTVTDIAGNTATATRTVTVNPVPGSDLIAPVITLNGAATVNLNVGDTYTELGAVAADNVDLVVNVNTAGAVDTAVAGTYVITYTATDVAGNAAAPVTRTVNVAALPVTASVVIASAAPVIVTGATQQISVAVLDPLGAAITPTPAVTLATADPLVATIDAAGVVTAVAPGTTTITATVEGAPVASIPVTVADPLPVPVATTVTATAATPTLVTGATQQLSVATLDQNGVIVAPAPAVIFTTTDPLVATVDAAGVVTAVAPGTVDITATVEGIPAATVPVTVAAPTPSPVVTAVSVANSAPIIVTGTTQQISVAAVDQVGAIITPSPVITLETANPAVATVDAGAIVTAVAPGATTITATADGVPVATIPITVAAPAPTPIVTTVDVVTAATTIPVGASQQLSVAVLDQNATAIVAPPAITLVSDNPAVATVNSATGVVTAVAPGTVTITVTCAGETATQVITVAAPVATLSSIAITNPATKLVYTVGDPLSLAGLVVTGTYSDNSTKVETVTTANVTGFNSAVPVSSRLLTITIGGKTTTYAIEVKAAPVVPPVTPPVVPPVVPPVDDDDDDNDLPKIVGEDKLRELRPDLADLKSSKLLDWWKKNGAKEMPGIVFDRVAPRVEHGSRPAIAAKKTSATIQFSTDNAKKTKIVFVKRGEKKYKKPVEIVVSGASTTYHSLKLSKLGKKTSYTFKVITLNDDGSVASQSKLITFKTQ